jgi:hypothetical protein
MSADDSNGGNGKRKPPTWAVDDKYKPVTAADVTDISLLPRQFEVFVAEMRNTLDIKFSQITRALEQVAQSLQSMDYTVRRLRDEQDAQRNALSEVEQRLSQPRAAKPRKRK